MFISHNVVEKQCRNGPNPTAFITRFWRRSGVKWSVKKSLAMGAREGLERRVSKVEVLVLARSISRCWRGGGKASIGMRRVKGGFERIMSVWIGLGRKILA